VWLYACVYEGGLVSSYNGGHITVRTLPVTWFVMTLYDSTRRFYSPQNVRDLISS